MKSEQQKDYETRITVAIANTCNFELREKDAKCRECGKRLTYHYVGMPLNERMLVHLGGHTGGRYPKPKYLR